MAKRASVAVNLVGPYARHGEPVIAACVEVGCHYLDLTGEIPFARRIIDRFHAKARDAGVKIVQVCGYEALPPISGCCSHPRPLGSALARPCQRPSSSPPIRSGHRGH
jgi:short subunit dehydrogenase-like uncharacterized protein